VLNRELTVVHRRCSGQNLHSSSSCFKG